MEKEKAKQAHNSLNVFDDMEENYKQQTRL